MTTNFEESLFELPDGRAISYNLTKISPGRPLVLLSNSLCSPLQSWDLVNSALLKNGFDTLRYDQPGHGKSGVPTELASTTFDSMAEDVYNLLFHLKITTLEAWVGVSMGASTGIYFAAKYPEIIKQLVPCDTITCAAVITGNADPFPRRVETMRAVGNMENLIAGTMDQWFGPDWIKSNADEAADMRDIMSKTTMDGFETCCAALSSPTFDLRPLLEAAGQGCTEAMVIVGEKDANLPITMQEIRAGIQKGNGKEVGFKTIKNSGHVCFIDGFEQFWDVLVTFLKS